VELDRVAVRRNAMRILGYKVSVTAQIGIAVVALNLAYLIVGVVVVETVFVYPGLGQLMVDEVSKHDVPVVQACGLIFAATFILLNMTADILAILSNPRLRQPR